MLGRRWVRLGEGWCGEIVWSCFGLAYYASVCHNMFGEGGSSHVQGRRWVRLGESWCRDIVWSYFGLAYYASVCHNVFGAGGSNRMQGRRWVRLGESCGAERGRDKVEG